jgi:hypothetical protein
MISPTRARKSMCPAPGTVSSFAPGMVSVVATPWPCGRSLSASPWITSTGTSTRRSASHRKGAEEAAMPWSGAALNPRVISAIRRSSPSAKCGPSHRVIGHCVRMCAPATDSATRDRWAGASHDHHECVKSLPDAHWSACHTGRVHIGRRATAIRDSRRDTKQTLEAHSASRHEGCQPDMGLPLVAQCSTVGGGCHRVGSTRPQRAAVIEGGTCARRSR